MRILLDENLDWRLRRLLPGHEVDSLACIGWSGMKNGALLRKAADVSAEGMLEVLRRLRPGMNDLEVAGIMEWVWKRQGSPRASFSPIVASLR